MQSVNVLYQYFVWKKDVLVIVLTITSSNDVTN
jgi:hypothetical protein